VSYGRRQLLWDSVAVLAVIGIAYGAWEMIAAKGWFLGTILAVVTVVAGAMAFKLVYPLWFGDR